MKNELQAMGFIICFPAQWYLMMCSYDKVYILLHEIDFYVVTVPFVGARGH